MIWFILALHVVMFFGGLYLGLRKAGLRIERGASRRSSE